MKKFLLPGILVLVLAALFAVIMIPAPGTQQSGEIPEASGGAVAGAEGIAPEVKSAGAKVGPLPKNPECKEGEEIFLCYDRFYKELTAGGVTVAMNDMRKRYEAEPYVRAECHQLMHVVGRTAGGKANNLSEAFAEGDSFCWSGYYHGVVEAFIQKGGKEILSEGKGLDGVCKALRESKPYSFDHYNCVHGLGHGIMAVKYNELFDSLKVCDLLTDSWDRTSCWGGAYMENIMADGKVHKTSYLKPNDPLYPCNAVDEKYQSQCYLMQTSYMLKVKGWDFAEVFKLCDSVGGANETTCYQSLGRDASGSTISDPVRTKEYCLLGTTPAQRENCVIGAVKDFISYHHSDTQAKIFCEALPDNLPALCLSTASSYYATF